MRARSAGTGMETLLLGSRDMPLVPTTLSLMSSVVSGTRVSPDYSG